MKLFPRSFRVSVVTVTVLATLVAAAAMGFTHYTMHKQRSESDLARLLKLSASESATRVARWLEVRRDSAASIAGSTTLIEELRRIRQLTPQDDEYFLALYRLKRELDLNTLSHEFIHEITIHDPETGAILLASTGEDVEIPQRKTTTAALQRLGISSGCRRCSRRRFRFPMKPRHPPMAVPSLLIAAPIRDGADLYGVLRSRAQVLDIGENLLRAANYSEYVRDK